MDNELTHFGIKGQRWGVRRFQKKDGTLTSAGKARKRDSRKSSNDETKKITTKTKEQIIKEGNIRAARLHLNSFSNDELNRIIARYELNTKISKLAQADINAGKVKAKEIANKMGDYAEAIDKGTKLYNNVAKVINSTSTNNLPIIGEKNDNSKKETTKVKEVTITKSDDGKVTKTVTKEKNI